MPSWFVRAEWFWNRLLLLTLFVMSRLRALVVAFRIVFMVWLYCGVCVILSHSCVWPAVGIVVVNLFHFRMRSVWCSGAGLVSSPTHVALRPWMFAARFVGCWRTLSSRLSSVFMGLPLYLLRPGWFLWYSVLTSWTS